MLRKILIAIYLVLAGWLIARWQRTPVSLPELVVRPVLPAVQGPPLSLLRERRYQELDTQLATFQTSYEQDPHTAENLLIPFRIFYAADPALEPYLDEWVTALPTSYAARVARATYYRKLAHEQRGKRFMPDTTPQQVHGMEKYFSLARQDLEASLRLTAKPVLSYVHLLDIGTYLGTAEWNRHLLEEALLLDPQDFIVRRKFMYSLRPKWGGGFVDMAAFLEECQRAGLPTPKIKTLEAVIFIEKGYARSAEKDEAGALAYFAQALQAEDGSEENLTAHEWKCAKHFKLQQFDLALPDCTVVLAYDVTNVWALQNRGASYGKLGDTEKAFKDYLAGAALGDARCQNEVGTMYWHGFGTARNKTEAIRWFQLAAKQGNVDAQKNLQEANLHWEE